MYEGIEREILYAYNDALLLGTTAAFNNLQVQVSAILAAADPLVRDWFTAQVPALYRAGAVNAAEALGATTKGVELFGSIAATRNKHLEAMQRITEGGYSRFAEVHGTVARLTEQTAREVALRNIQDALHGADTYKTAARKIAEDLRTRGITGFVDRRGVEWSLSRYSEMVARTTLMESHLQGTMNRFVQDGRDLVEVSSHGAEDECANWEGAILSISGNTPGYDTVSDAQAGTLFHPNCLVGDTMVSGPRPLSVSSRRYDGDVIVITTAEGQELTVTPNHPILTPEGFIAARLLSVGSKVVCCGDSEGRILRVAPDDIEVPSRIKNATAAFGQTRGVSTRRMPVAPEDFHGDGTDSEVCVVYTDSRLRDGRDTTIREHASENRLALAIWQAFAFLRGCASLLLGNGVLTSTDGFMSWRSKRTTFLGSHTRKTYLRRLRARLGRHNTAAPKAVMDGHLTHAEAQSDVLLRFAGQIRLDDVVDIEVKSIATHVYNLSTGPGWYVANGIITHNCKHDLLAVTDDELARL